MAGQTLNKLIESKIRIVFRFLAYVLKMAILSFVMVTPCQSGSKKKAVKSFSVSILCEGPI